MISVIRPPDLVLWLLLKLVECFPLTLLTIGFVAGALLTFLILH